MKKILAVIVMGLLSSGAWAGQTVFGGSQNSDLAGSILLDLNNDKTTRGGGEKGTELYGTAMKAEDEMAKRERDTERAHATSPDYYGNVIHDVRPNLHY